MGNGGSPYRQSGNPLLLVDNNHQIEIASINGVVSSGLDGAGPTPFGQPSGDKFDLFKARAQSIISGPFGCATLDFIGATTDMASGGFTPISSLAQITSGRGAGGSRGLFTLGAGGLFFQAIQGQALAAVPFVIADQASDAWYMETIVNVLTLTGNSEFLPCTMWQRTAGDLAATDAGSPPFAALTINAAISTTFWVLKANAASGAQTLITTIPIEFGTTRHIGYGHDGWGTLYTMRDGVIFDRFQQFSNAQHVVGTFGINGRGLAGTMTAQVDSVSIAGMYL